LLEFFQSSCDRHYEKDFPMSIWSVSIGLVVAGVVTMVSATVSVGSDIQFSGYFLTNRYGPIDFERHPVTGVNRVLVNHL